jgi:polysaccharide biosynthesis/export protein
MTMIVEMILGMLLGQVGQPPAAILSPPRGAEGAAHKADAGTATEGTSPASATVPASAVPGYRIGPEDVLQIDVWKEADFSASSPVRADGKISVPLLNDVQAAGFTPIELAAYLREQLSKYVVDPKITVSVTQMNSRKAYVMGEVNRQGIVRLQSNLTVLQAISAAGGLAPFANGKKIYVLRSRGGEQLRLPFNYDAVIKGKRSEQNVVLQPGDTIIVP